MATEPRLLLEGPTYRLALPSPVPALCYGLTALATAALGLAVLFAAVPLVGRVTVAALPVAGVALLVTPPVAARLVTRALLARYPRLGGRFELVVRLSGGAGEESEPESGSGSRIRPRYN
jgi:hypothetical protein